MRCQGRPEDGVCPENRNDSTVHNTIADLFLCNSCEEYRWPSLKSVSTSNDKLSGVQGGDKKAISSDEPTGSTDATSQLGRKFVVDDLLYFAFNKLDHVPENTLKSIVNEFYREDEVLAAKHNLLRHISDTKALGISGYMKKRIGDNKVKHTTDDIFSIIAVIDERGIRDTLPVFCSASPLRIPVVPDEMSDLVAVRHDVHCLKVQLDAKISDEVSDLSTLSNNVHCIKDELRVLNNKIDMILAWVDKKCVTPSLTRTSYSEEYPPISAATNMMSNKGDGTVSYHREASVTVAPNVSLTDENDQIQTETDMDFVGAVQRKPDTDTDGFQMVTGKKGKKRTKFIVGNSTAGTTLKGIVRRSVVCVNRLDPTVTPAMLSDFLKDNGICVFTCYDVTNKGDKDKAVDPSNSSHSNRRRNFTCMRVCVAYPDLKKMYDTEMWPLGVVVRPWSFKKRESPQADNQSL